MIGVYKYENSDGEVVYIGKAKDIRARYCHHYYIGDISNWFGKEKFSFAYIETNSITDADIFETLLINIYKPKHNKYKKYGDKSIFKIPDNYAWLYVDWGYCSYNPDFSKDSNYGEIKRDRTPDIESLGKYLESVISTRLYKCNKDDLKAVFIRNNIYKRTMGINSLNKLLKEYCLPYEITSHNENRRRVDQYKRRYWIVRKVEI